MIKLLLKQEAHGRLRSPEIQWRYAYLLHFYDMIWNGICMLWYAIFMLCYEILINDMIWYAIVWCGVVWYGMVWYAMKFE